MTKENKKEKWEEPRLCIECGREIYFMEMESCCEACAIGMAGGFRERPTVETLKKVYWKLNEQIPQLLNQAQIKLLETLAFLDSEPSKLLFQTDQYKAIYKIVADVIKDAAKAQIKKLKKQNG